MRKRQYRTAGLDQLGPKHYITSWHPIKPKIRSLSERIKTSASKRKRLVTLPKLRFSDV